MFSPVFILLIPVCFLGLIAIIIFALASYSDISEEIYPSIEVSEDGGSVKLIDEGDTWKSVGWYTKITIIFGWFSSVSLGLGLLKGEYIFVAVGGLISIVFVYFVYRTICEILTVMRLDPGELHFDSWPVTWGEETEAEFRRGVKSSTTIRSADIHLRCREVVRRGGGTDERTFSTTLLDESLATIKPGGPTHTEISESFTFTPYKEFLHSLDVRRNNVIWEIVAYLDIDNQPDDESTFEILVKPEANHD